MQELRFVTVEDGWVLASSPSGEEFRLRIDDALRQALRPRPVQRTPGPRVAPREIQQLIRAGRTVDEVVAATGADEATVARFEGPILAERAYVVEQARAVPVRVSAPVDPLAGEGASFGAVIDARLEALHAQNVRWDAWRDPETGWHVGLDFMSGEAERNALWEFDVKGHTLRPASPTAVTLSQQGDAPTLTGPHLRAVQSDTGELIPVEHEDADASEAQPLAGPSLTTYETADLLEQLRRRRGERQHSVYDEMAEYDEDDFVLEAVEAESLDGAVPPAEGAGGAGAGAGASGASGAGAAGAGAGAGGAGASREATVTQLGARRAAVAREAAGSDGPDAAAGSAAGSAAGTQDAAPGAERSSGDAPDQAAAAKDGGPSAPAKNAGGATGGDGRASSSTTPSVASTGASSSATPSAASTDASSSAAVGDQLDLAVEQSPNRGSVPDAAAPRKRGARPAMPSWDEIVFGTRTDD